MSFINFVQAAKPELETAISEFLEKKSTEYSRVPLYSESIKKIKALSLAGKMWRGLFVLFILQQITGSYTKESLHAAIAMELIQTALLTHDDIIDNDMTRRGMPTIYAQYAQNGSIEYGKNMGICVGDIAIFLAYEALVQSNTTPTQLSKLLQTFSRELQLVGVGEMLDVKMADSNKDPSIEEITNMYRYKTARYTFSLPFLLGALLANAEESTQHSLDTFGENAGILFQIRDDGLDLTGNEKETGKPVGADIKENKKTIHRALLFEKSSPEEKETLSRLFGKKDLTNNERETVLSLLKTRAVDESIEKTETAFKDNAIASILNLSDNLKQSLLEILELVHSRKK